MIASNGTYAYIGGLIGYNDSGTVSACYSNNTVYSNAENNHEGGLLGYSTGGAITKCYYNSDIGARDLFSSGLTAGRMKVKDSYIGFDFDNIWKMKENINRGMPYLKDNPAPEDIYISSVTLNKLESTIIIGNTLELLADIQPENATYRGLIWSSSDENIASVEAGVVTGISVGSAIITVTTEDGAKTANCVIIVTEPPYTVGDINLDDILDITDATLLFQHSTMPDIYPVQYAGSLDFNNDGTVDIDDATLVFCHSMMPDIYPLA